MKLIGTIHVSTLRWEAGFLTLFIGTISIRLGAESVLRLFQAVSPMGLPGQVELRV